MEDEIGDLMYRYHRERIEGLQYRRLIEDLVNIEEFSVAEKWARRAMKTEIISWILISGVSNIILHTMTEMPF